MGMGQTGAMVLSHIPRKDLHLAREASKSRTMDDPISIPLKRTSIRVLRLTANASKRIDRVHRVAC